MWPEVGIPSDSYSTVRTHDVGVTRGVWFCPEVVELALDELEDDTRSCKQEQNRQTGV